MVYRLKNNDCLEIMKKIPDKTVDLIVTDPPYLIKNTQSGGKSEFARSIQPMNDEIRNASITEGFDYDSCLKEMERIMKKPNIYIFCNKAQIPIYIKYFVIDRNYTFDILCWVKTNAMPLFNNKYLTDKEYCLYFKKGGMCSPQNYDDAKTVFFQPINAKDKKKYGHPTIKPLNIIETLVKNSSKEGDIILDPFMGSGTTGVACKNLNRNFIGVEINQEYYNIAQQRMEE